MRGRRYLKSVRAQAFALRAGGSSLQEISDELRVPKNTLSGWVAHVELTDAMRKRLKSKERESAARGRPLAVEAWRRKTERWKEGIRAQVEHLGSLPFDQPDIGRLACGLLYVCEGGKYPSTRRLSFANTDPRMITFFLTLLRRYFPVEEKKLRVRIMHRWDQDGEALRRFWSQVTGIPFSQCYATQPDLRTKGHPTRRSDYRGVCDLTYSSTTLQYTLQAIGESVMKVVEQEGIEPSASCMPCKRSVQTELLPRDEPTITSLAQICQ